jgi:arabinosaccharide transport system substrate-binding protein
MFRTSRLFILATILVMIAVSVLSGCSQQSSTPPSSEGGGGESSSGGGETAITFWTFNALHQTFYEDAAKRWNEANPDRKIKLEATTYPYQDMHNNLLLSIQSGVGAPDMADIEISKFANFLKGTPQLESLNDIVDPVKDKMVQSRLDIYSKDGTVYGLPTHVGAAVMYYNTELLGQAGVNPDDIKTWDDYMEAGKKVLAATSKPMTTIETADQWTFWPMIVQRGSDYLGKDGSVILDNDKNIATLEFIKSMADEGIAIPVPGGNHHAEEYYGFMSQGGSASVLMPIWYMGRFTEYMPDLKGKIAIRPLPSWEAGGKRSAGMGGTGTVITTQSKNKKLVKDFLAYAKLSEEGNIKIWTELGFDPPRWDVWESDAVKQPNKFSEYFGDGIFDMLLTIRDEIDSPVTGELTPQASDLVKTAVMFRSIQEKSATPEQALKDAAEELRKK